MFAPCLMRRSRIQPLSPGKRRLYKAILGLILLSLFIIIQQFVVMASVNYQKLAPEVTEFQVEAYYIPEKPKFLAEIAGKTVYEDVVVHNDCGYNCTTKFIPAAATSSPAEEYPYYIPENSHLDVDLSSLVSSPLRRNLKTYKNVKYFKESKYSPHLTAGTELIDHRFLYTRFEKIQALFSAWALFADQHEIPYWIAHGSLIGWHWNRKTMIFDDDVDVQVLENTLFTLEKHNGFTFLDQYKLDVNPNHVYREPYEKNRNIIDARFIDTKSGLFIDITGLSTVEPTTEITRDTYIRCKSPHKYKVSDIFPLKRSKFNGVPTWVPNNVKAVVDSEYGPSALQESIFGDYRFDPFLREWIKIDDCVELHRVYVHPFINNYKKGAMKLMWSSNSDGFFYPERCNVVMWYPNAPSKVVSAKWHDNFQHLPEPSRFQ